MKTVNYNQKEITKMEKKMVYGNIIMKMVN